LSLQNCNSLNLTGTTGNFDAKLIAIVQAKTDIILLSDTRVVSAHGVSSTHRISNTLRDSSIKKYMALFNSSANSRGTAILVSLDLNIVINKEYKDPAENYYIIDTTINGVRYGIGAIYGPNNTSRDFYRNLRLVLGEIKNNSNEPINFILGGDWNTVWDRRPIQSNIDVFCMAAVPNSKNSELLEQMCSMYDLVDPYRTLYPLKRDYSYVPFGNVRLNRSRLDLFVVSRELVVSVTECKIDSSVSSKLFDHKRVSLFLNKELETKQSVARLSNSFLTDRLLTVATELAARKTAIFAMELDRGLSHPTLGLYKDIREQELQKTVECYNLMMSVLKMRERLAVDYDELLSNQIAGAETELAMQIENMIPIEDLY
jgi:exonuclease III